MSYSSACKTTTTTPCTNVPIHCPLCPPLSPGSPVTIWKYNTMAHLLTAHIDENDSLPDLPPGRL
ncbi:hypothetical protein BD413DRAFT_553505 [Trametes elegans]|nr:hypothetical protein BD413DRAFT_553505 [Trametes elegans]